MIVFGDILGVDTGEPAVAAAVIGAAGGLLLAGGRAIAWLVSGPRDRRRALYGTAYQDAMAWLEMLYRVRRRANEDADERQLVERFHVLQERIDYHRGWLGSESRYLARSYCRLVREIKQQSESPLQKAWRDPGCRPAEPPVIGEPHPSVEPQSLRFLTDVRLHLSLWPVIPRLTLMLRNLKQDTASPVRGEETTTKETATP